MPFPLSNRVRVAGSGFTIFYFEGQPISFAQQIAHTSPAPVGAGPVAIHPIDEPYPVQVITPAASGMGSLTLNLFELYTRKVWERLGGTVDAGGDQSANNSFVGDIPSIGFLQGAVDLVDVMIRIAERPDRVTVVKKIRTPNLNGAGRKEYTEHYNNCVVTNITDGEQIEVGTMEVIKQVTLAYTYVTRYDAGGNVLKSRAWDYRDGNFATS